VIILDTTRTAPAAARRGAAAPPARRALAWPAAALLVLGLAACGDEAEEVDAIADEDSELPELDANGMLGLEVTVVGEVTEMLDSNAFRMDKDGLGVHVRPGDLLSMASTTSTSRSWTGR